MRPVKSLTPLSKKITENTYQNCTSYRILQH